MQFAMGKSMRSWCLDRRVKSVFTLEGAEHPYRVLVESMNEGADLAHAGRYRYPLLQRIIRSLNRVSARSNHGPRPERVRTR